MTINRNPVFLYVLLFLVCLFAFGNANAQQQAVVSKYFTEADGLSNKAVRCIIEDGYGVLWVGTMYGLNRFDGRGFRHFTTEDGLKSNVISRLRKLNDRYLLLFYGEANFFSIQHLQVFDVLTKKVVAWEAVAGLFPFRIADLKEVEAANRNLGLLFYLKNGKHFSFDAQGKFEQIRGLSPALRFLAHTKNGEHWSQVLNEDSLVVLKKDKQGNTLQRVNLGYENKNGTAFLAFLGTAKNGSTYFAVLLRKGSNPDPRYIVRVFPSGRCQVLRETPSTINCEEFDIFVITQNPNTGNYWAINNEKAVLFSEHWETICEVPQLGNSEDKMVPHTRQSCFDKSGVWQISHVGFFRIDFYTSKFENIERLNPLSGTRGIVRFQNKLHINSEYTYQYDESSKKEQQLGAEMVGAAITLDQNGDLWTGNYLRFYHRAAATGEMMQYKMGIRELWGIWADTATGIWLGGEGFECFNPKTATFETIDFQKFSEIKSATIYHFQPLSANKVWVTTSLGLYELNPQTRKITARYWTGGKGKYYFPADDFHHLYLEKDKKTVWLATGGKGFLRWRPQSDDKKLFSLSQSETNIVHAILPDNYGFLWFSTEKGLVQFDPKTEQVRIYTTKDGLVVNEFNRISHFRDADGTLYFGSINGVTVVRPERFKNTFLKKTKKELFVVDVQQYIGSARRVEERTEAWTTQKKLTLEPDDRFFTLTLGVRDYSYAKDAAFFYQIKDYDKEWIAAENQRVTFGRLPYGQRTILAKALLSNGQYSEILEIPVSVKRPFYLRWWFVLLSLALLVGAAYWRFNDLRQRNLFLKKEVARRTENIQQAKEVVEAQAEKLRTLDKMKSRFFANISHELRTPLTLIAAPLQQLIKQEHSTDKKQLVQFAFNNSQRLLRLVNQILDLTKLENTGLQLEEKEVALLPFSRRIVAEFESFAAHKGVQLGLYADLDENAVCSLDANKLETILYNFLSNALKFTPQGGSVFLHLKPMPEGVTFEVTDTGRGIATEDLPHLFDRFYQSQKQNTAEGGTGIGLAICKEFATLMRGSIEVESALGKGTTFKFVLPITFLPQEIVAETPETDFSKGILKEGITKNTAANQPAARAKNTALPHLLLVEDNEDLQRYIAILLRQDYRLTITNNGRAALDFLESCEANARPALILSDIMMPEMDGFELLQCLKSSDDYRKIPTIMLTARAGADDRLKALRIGVDDYLTKPFLEDELLVRIDNLLKNAAERTDFGASEETADEPMQSEWLKSVEIYILENMNAPTFSVNAIAETLEVSRQLLTRRIGQQVGMTTLNYVQEVRLNEARRLLESGEAKTVKEAAARVGLPNAKLFARKFLERFGKYPSDYLQG